MMDKRIGDTEPVVEFMRIDKLELKKGIYISHNSDYDSSTFSKLAIFEDGLQNEHGNEFILCVNGTPIKIE